MTVFFKKLKDSAVIPTKATPGSAGYDLRYCATEAVEICPGQTKALGTGLATQFDSRLCAKVHSRSGLALNKSIFVLNAPGVVDSDYRGEIKVILHNAGREEVVFSPGDRIAQILFEVVPTEDVLEAESLDESVRGEGGFGSTGVK